MTRSFVCKVLIAEESCRFFRDIVTLALAFLVFFLFFFLVWTVSGFVRMTLWIPVFNLVWSIVFSLPELIVLKYYWKCSRNYAGGEFVRREGCGV